METECGLVLSCWHVKAFQKQMLSGWEHDTDLLPIILMKNNIFSFGKTYFPVIYFLCPTISETYQIQKDNISWNGKMSYMLAMFYFE